MNYDLMKGYGSFAAEEQKNKIEREMLVLKNIGYIDIKYDLKSKSQYLKLMPVSQNHLEVIIMKFLDQSYCIGKYRMMTYIEEIFQSSMRDPYVYDRIIKKTAEGRQIDLVKRE